MADGEREFVCWLAERTGRSVRADSGRNAVGLGIGDDMAIVKLGADRQILITADMLLDGTHFDTRRHSLEAIGRKAVACSLSDCAAMAVRPVAATISLGLPRGWLPAEACRLAEAMIATAEEFGCAVIGGDTTSWDQRLAIDVAMLAEPYPGVAPVRRDGARPGDGVFVTGTLGGSLLGKHLSFVPRVREARSLAEALGGRLHGLMDISDGLAIDLDRMAEASGVAAVLDEGAVLAAADEAAEQAAQTDGRSRLDHVLADGEDFELLLAAEVDVDWAAALSLRRVGGIVAGRGLRLRAAGGGEEPLAPGGYQHQ